MIVLRLVQGDRMVAVFQLFDPGVLRTAPLAEAAERHAGGRMRAVVAWASGAGVERLRAQIIRERLDDIQVVVGGNGRLTELDAVLRLRQMGARIWVAYYNDAEIFHHKVYAFDGGYDPGAFSLLCGGSNLTEGGLASNGESLLGVHAGSEERHLIEEAVAGFEDGWARLTDPDNQYVHPVETDDDLRRLYRQGLVVSSREASRRREQERVGRRTRDSGQQAQVDRPPVKPRAKVDRSGITPLPAPFPLDAEPVQAPAPPVPGVAVPPVGTRQFGRFYVRTLTGNDVAKLTNQQVGTFEPDIGEGPRDIHPDFWRWPDQYEEVVRQVARDEYETTAALITPLTGDREVSIGLRLWYRPDREGHAAEHRLTPVKGPNGDLIKAYVPEDFDVEGIMVLEEAPEEEAFEYIVRLIRPDDPDYNFFRPFASNPNPGHHYGYGPGA